jgi:hypothetical protein
MSNKNSNSNAEMPAPAKIEFAYYTGRNIMLMIVAITSVIVTFRLGGFVAEAYDLPTWANYLIRNFAVFLGFGFDLILITALGGISMPSSKSKMAWMLAILALIVTLVLSLCSNWFFSEDSGGESNFKTYQEALISKMQQDSINKSKALDMVSAAGEEESKRIKNANSEATTLLDQAIKKGSQRWQDDYRKAMDNERAWFWVCQQCPAEYKAYRDGIKAAKQQGQEVKQSAYGYSQQIASMVAPTLSANVSSDSSMVELKMTTINLEDERKRKSGLMFWILTALTVGAAIMAMVLSVVLRDHRQEHGQYFHEDHIEMFVIIFDLLGTIKHMVLDLLQNLLVRPYNALVGWGLIEQYEATNTRWSPVAQGTNNQQSDQQSGNSNSSNNQQSGNQQQQKQRDSNNSTRSNSQQEEEESTDDKDCKTGKCPPRGRNGTAGTNKTLTADAKELVVTAERCRTRYKRSFTSKTEEAKQRNYDRAMEDVLWLRDRGAIVQFDSADMEMEINLPKV